MFCVRRVGVRVPGAVWMHVLMQVEPVPRGFPESPGGVEGPDCDQHPGRQLSTNRFQHLQPEYGDAERDADRADQDGAEDVAESAEGGDGEGLGSGPALGPAHRKEREIVVGAQEGVEESERRRGCG